MGLLFRKLPVRFGSFRFVGRPVLVPPGRFHFRFRPVPVPSFLERAIARERARDSASALEAEGRPIGGSEGRYTPPIIAERAIARDFAQKYGAPRVPMGSLK